MGDLVLFQVCFWLPWIVLACAQYMELGNDRDTAGAEYKGTETLQEHPNVYL